MKSRPVAGGSTNERDEYMNEQEGLEVGGGFAVCMAVMLVGLGYILGTL